MSPDDAALRKNYQPRHALTIVAQHGTRWHPCWNATWGGLYAERQETLIRRHSVWRFYHQVGNAIEQEHREHPRAASVVPFRAHQSLHRMVNQYRSSLTVGFRACHRPGTASCSLGKVDALGSEPIGQPPSRQLLAQELESTLVFKSLIQEN